MDMEQSTLTPLTPRQLEALHARLNRDRVLQRSGMSYLEAWDVKASLIKVFGYGGFSAECLDAKIIRDEQVAQTGNSDRTNWAVSAQATVRLTIPQLGVVYTESAIATNKQPDWGEAADTALKSAESDALKRAAIYLGTQFGLSLYKNGTTDNIINTVLAPGQQEIVEDITIARAKGPEAESALNRLQARMKVHPATVTDVPAVVSEATVTEPPAPAPVQVATLTAPAAVPVAKALENAERLAAELDQAEATPAPAKRRRAAPKAKSTVTADRQAVARQALATAEQRVGLGDPYDEQNFAADDARQVMEDSQ